MTPAITVDYTKINASQKKVELTERSLNILLRCPPNHKDLALCCVLMDEASAIDADLEAGRLEQAEARIGACEEILTRKGL